MKLTVRFFVTSILCEYEKSFANSSAHGIFLHHSRKASSEIDERKQSRKNQEMAFCWSKQHFAMFVCVCERHLAVMWKSSISKRTCFVILAQAFPCISIWKSECVHTICGVLSVFKTVRVSFDSTFFKAKNLSEHVSNADTDFLFRFSMTHPLLTLFKQQSQHTNRRISIFFLFLFLSLARTLSLCVCVCVCALSNNPRWNWIWRTNSDFGKILMGARARKRESSIEKS